MSDDRNGDLVDDIPFEPKTVLASPELLAGAKICTACEHIATSYSGWEAYKCRSKENEIDRSLNLVDGSYIIRRKTDLCSSARNDENLCGKEGKWYHERKFKIPEKISGPESKKSSHVTADDL